jgi:tripartite-type tricarboxylate transporter receptor subunit TctC
VGIADAANAAPDGYTLVLVSSSTVSDRKAEDLLKKTSRFPFGELTPIALFSVNPLVLAVAAESKWPELKAFVQQAASQPSELSFGVVGDTGPSYLMAGLFERVVGKKELQRVPFRSEQDALQYLLEKKVAAIFVEPRAVMGSIENGKVRALAVSGDARLPTLPDVPTFKESGFQALEFYIWTGLFAPPGTPGPVVDTLRKAAGEIAQGSAFEGDIYKLGFVPSYKDAPAFRTFRDKDLVRIRASKDLLQIGNDDGNAGTCWLTRSSYDGANCEVQCTNACRGLGQELRSPRCNEKASCY